MPAIRRRLLLTLACRLCGSTRIKKDAVAIECDECGAIRPRRASDEHIVASIANWTECPLSTAEIRTLAAIFHGASYKQAALDSGLSISTIRTHLHNTYGKLGVHGAVQACILAYERGWLLAAGGVGT